MKDGYLFDALNEISDEHIAEAVTYEPKIKVISWKKIAAVAACLLVVAVTAIAISDTNKPPVTSTEPSAYSTTKAGTTVANVPVSPGVSEQTTIASSTTSASIDVCPTIARWEQRPYSSCFSEFIFNGKKYGTNGGAVIDEGKVSKVLGEVTATATDDDGKEHSVTADVCEIEGVEAECAVAVWFKDGPNKDYCVQGYYVYVDRNYTPKNLGEIMDKLNLSENIVWDMNGYVHYDASNASGITTKKYAMDEEIIDAFVGILQNGRNAAGVRTDTEYSEENLHLYANILGRSYAFHLTKEGYIYFGLSDSNLRYDIGKDAYQSFLSLLESKGAAEEQPLLSPTTQVSASQGYTVDIPSEYEEGNNSSESQTTRAAYIPDGLQTEN